MGIISEKTATFVSIYLIWRTKMNFSVIKDKLKKKKKNEFLSQQK